MLRITAPSNSYVSPRKLNLGAADQSVNCSSFGDLGKWWGLRVKVLLVGEALVVNAASPRGVEPGVARKLVD